MQRDGNLVTYLIPPPTPPSASVSSTAEMHSEGQGNSAARPLSRDYHFLIGVLEQLLFQYKALPYIIAAAEEEENRPKRLFGKLKLGRKIMSFFHL